MKTLEQVLWIFFSVFIVYLEQVFSHNIVYILTHGYIHASVHDLFMNTVWFVVNWTHCFDSHSAWSSFMRLTLCLLLYQKWWILYKFRVKSIFLNSLLFSIAYTSVRKSKKWWVVSWFFFFSVWLPQRPLKRKIGIK